MALKREASLDNELSKKHRLDHITYLFNQRDSLICPITRQLPVHPSYCEDGYVYETSSINKWVMTKNTSPMNPSVTIDVANIKFCRRTRESIENLIHEFRRIYNQNFENDEIKLLLEEYDNNKKKFIENKENNAKANFDIAMTLVNRAGSSNYSQVIDLLTKSAEMEYIPAASYLSEYIHEKSNKTSSDLLNIVKWAKKAYEFEDKIGCFRLAYAYEFGQGIEKNWKKAHDIYKMIDDICHTAKLRRAFILKDGGNELIKDETNAFKIFCELQHSKYLSEEDKKLVTYTIGTCHYFGYGTNINLFDAYNTLNSEKNPYYKSHNLLGCLLLNNKLPYREMSWMGPPKLSFVERGRIALTEFQLGSNKGDPLAKKNLKILEEKMMDLNLEDSC